MTGRAALWGGLLVGAVAAQPRVTTLQVGKDEVVLALSTVDVDGDGRADIAVVVRDEASTRRRLLLFVQRSVLGAPAFEAAPTQTRVLEPDVVAFAFADSDGARGAELILCTPRVIAMAAWPSGEPRALGTARVLWQPGHAGSVVSLQGFVRDLDGDGLADLVVPEPDGYRVALQRRDADGTRLLMQPLNVPPSTQLPAFLRGRVDSNDRSLRISLGDDEREPLLDVSEEVAVPRVLDFDGDGDLDIVALTRPNLHVFAQQPGGVFAPAPTVSHAMAATERTLLLEPVFFADAVDLDGDGKGELVVCRAQTRGGDAFETVVEVWAPSEKDARARLRLQGLAAPPLFDDVDGDGAPDLTIGTLRTDMLGQLSGGGDDVEVQLNVFLLRGGKPKLPAALTWRTRLSPQAVEGARSVAAEFFGDADGDGVRDLLLHDSARTLQVLKGVRAGEGLRVEPFWHTALPDGARPPFRIARTPCDDIVVVAKQEILHVRFR